MNGVESVLPVEVDDRLLAVPAAAVIEIVGARDWVAIPNAPRIVPGALVWRGRALALLDLAAALGLTPTKPPTTRARNLIVRAADDVVALAVDRALEVRTPSAELRAPVELAVPTLAALILDDEPVPLIDLDAWLDAWLAAQRSA